DELVLVTEHVANALQRRLHGVLVGAGLEVDERLVAEVAAGSKRKDHGRDFCGSYNRIVYGSPDAAGESAGRTGDCAWGASCYVRSLWSFALMFATTDSGARWPSPLDNLEDCVDDSS